MLDDNNDIYMGSDNRVSRAESFAERTMRLVGTTLRTFEGECFTNYDIGIPWFDDVLGKQTLFIDEISSEIKDKISAIEGVEEVIDLMIEVDGRNVSGKYKIRISDDSVVTDEF